MQQCENDKTIKYKNAETPTITIMPKSKTVTCYLYDSMLPFQYQGILGHFRYIQKSGYTSFNITLVMTSASKIKFIVRLC